MPADWWMATAFVAAYGGVLALTACGAAAVLSGLVRRANGKHRA